MSGTIVNKSIVASGLSNDIKHKNLGFYLESVDDEAECTNLSVDEDCNYYYEALKFMAEEYKPYIDNLTDYIKKTSDAFEEQDKELADNK